MQSGWMAAEGAGLLPGAVAHEETLIATAIREVASPGSKAPAPWMSPSLTVIPEQPQFISNFFRVVLAGSGSTDLTEVVCGSQLSEAYRPRVLRRSGRKAKVGPGDTSPTSPTSPTLTRRFSVSSSTSTSSTGAGQCFFCPLGVTRDRLACLKFEVVEGFSTSLPAVRTEAEARDTCVVLLHWPAAGVVAAEEAAAGHRGRPATGRAEAEDSSLQDLRRRVAELNFQMKYPPMVFLLCVANTEEESHRAREVASSCKLSDGRCITLLRGTDSSERGLGGALKRLADAALQEQEESPRTRGPGFSWGRKPRDGSSKPCCDLM